MKMKWMFLMMSLGVSTALADQTQMLRCVTAGSESKKIITYISKLTLAEGCSVFQFDPNLRAVQLIPTGPFCSITSTEFTVWGPPSGHGTVPVVIKTSLISEATYVGMVTGDRAYCKLFSTLSEGFPN